ncbi:carbohydrate ABC transporter permease [Enterococcus diestrammenae]|uniref:Multiple sugar transport system permease n=1 Tax=Enterococcus diestrammenae TaxID=1155073 RepID=A0ABV0EYW5_9ENTE|nr:sugar ABC transporter permease [Enterococcus diestrammenae]KAF1294708.1 ABC transporter permease [Enterococcus diestrammenae]HIX70663.1 sugar ABC transporter permease [Candidatus Enterococcus stercoravium]
MNKKLNLKPIAFIGPHILLFATFILIPTIYGIYASFTKWNLVSDPEWVGLDNYKTILFDSSSTFNFQFTNGLKNTLIYVVIMVPLLILIPLLIAVALENRHVKFKSLFQGILYVPGLVSISAAALIWSLIFHSKLGMMNNLFGMNFSWAAKQPYAWLLVIIVSVWGGIGGNMVIYRAAIAGVSQDLYESAEIDGATAFEKFIHITLPSIKFPLVYTLVMTTAGCFNVFAQPLMMTKGGPKQGTHVLMMYIRSLAFGHGESIAGIASAMAVLLGLIILVISAIQYYLMNKNTD